MTATTGEQLLADYLARLDAAALRLPPDRRAELREGISEHVAEARAAGELRDETAVRTLLDRLGDPEEIVAAAAEDGPAAGPGRPWSGRPPGAPPQLVPRPPGTGLELAAVIMLTVGSLVPVVGWLVGVALLWSSRRWRTGEKLIGTLVVPGGPGILLPLSLLSFGSGTCSVGIVGDLDGESALMPPLEPLSPQLPGDPTAPLPAPPELAPPAPPQVVETCADPWLSGPAVAGLTALALVGPVLVAVLLLRRARARAAAEPPVLRPVGGSGWGGLETTAVLLLAFGSFVLPFVGSLVGLVLAWTSPRWTPSEKTVATVLTLLPAGVVALSLLGGPLVLPFGLFAAVFLGLFAQLFAAGYLALVLNRRPVG